jgi:hypothetical protein
MIWRKNGLFIINPVAAKNLPVTTTKISSASPIGLATNTRITYSLCTLLNQKIADKASYKILSHLLCHEPVLHDLWQW